MHIFGTLALGLALAPFSASAKSHPGPDYTLNLMGSCCRIWSRSRGCIESMSDPGGHKNGNEISCYPAGITADWAPTGIDAVDPKCQIWNIARRKCMELTDGREDGWNPQPDNLLEASIRGKTVTMHYNHKWATFTPTDVATTMTKTSGNATFVVVRTSVTSQTTSASPLSTSTEVVTVSPATNEGFWSVGHTSISVTQKQAHRTLDVTTLTLADATTAPTATNEIDASTVVLSTGSDMEYPAQTGVKTVYETVNVTSSAAPTPSGFRTVVSTPGVVRDAR